MDLENLKKVEAEVKSKECYPVALRELENELLLNQGDIIEVRNSEDAQWTRRRFSHFVAGPILMCKDLDPDIKEAIPWKFWQHTTEGKREYVLKIKDSKKAENAGQPKDDRKYMVYIKNQNGPKVVHNSLEDADKELDRLLLKCKNAGEVGYVFELVKTKTTKIVVEEQV